MSAEARRSDIGGLWASLFTLPARFPRLAVLATCAAYALAVVLSYLGIVSPRWSYAGLVVNSAGDGTELFALVLAVVPAIWLPIRLAAPSGFVLWAVYLLVYVPALTLTPIVTGSGWQLLLFVLAVAAGFAVLSLVPTLPTPRVRLPALSPSRYTAFIAVTSLLFGAVVIWRLGIPTNVPGLLDVYDVRDDYKASLAESGRVLGYAVSWLGNSVAPILLVYGVWRRNLWLIGLGAASLLLVYGVAGFKSVLFASVVAVAVYVLARSRPATFGLVAPSILTVVVILGSVAALLGSNALISLFVRRLIHVPGVLTGFYHDFFSSHQTYLLSHSVLGWLFEQPYPESPAHLIGRVYFDSPGTSANANFWADGIANFGLAGVFIATVLLGALLFGVDLVSRDKPLSVAVAAFSAPALSLTNSALLTSIMTHGIGLMVLLLLLLPPDDSEGTAPSSKVNDVANPPQPTGGRS